MPNRPNRLGLTFLPLIIALFAGSATAEEPDRSPIALALNGEGSRLAGRQPDGGLGFLGRHCPRAGPRRVRRQGTGRAGWRSRRTARSASSPTGSGMTWPSSTSDGDRADGRRAGRGRPRASRGGDRGATGRSAYVAVGASNEVVRVDLAARKVTGRVEVGREPRGLAITPDGSRLVVGNARGQSVSVVDLGKFAVERTLPMLADNLRQVAVSPDGRYAYVAAMNNRGFADDPEQHRPRLGPGPADRAGRCSTAPSPPSASRSTRGAMRPATPTGSPSATAARLLAVACGGTHEVILLRDDDKPLAWRNGRGPRRRSRPACSRTRSDSAGSPLGGRPTEIAFAPDGKTLYVANYLANAIQVVDADSADPDPDDPAGRPRDPLARPARRGPVPRRRPVAQQLV